MCVYWSVLAGRGRNLGQNNGTTLECGTAGNILSQKEGSLGVEEESFVAEVYKSCIFNQSHDTLQAQRPLVLTQTQDGCTQSLLVKLLSFHTTTKLENDVPQNISQTHDSFSEISVQM